MAHRYVFGLLSAKCSGDARKLWNALIREQGIDGFFDFYPTVTVQDLELRLAEMFHLGRRAYILAPALRDHVVPLLDRMDSGVASGSEPDTVINEGGVLTGYSLNALPPALQLREWVSRSTAAFSD